MMSFKAALAALLITASAHARETGEECATSRDCNDYCIEGICRSASWKPPPRDYALQVVAADLVALATLGTFSILSGPLIHLAHERFATAGASFGLRVFGISLSAGSGVLVALALPAQNFNALGCFQCGPSPNYLPQMFAGVLIGAAVGWIVASVIDAKFLAHTR